MTNIALFKIKMNNLDIFLIILQKPVGEFRKGDNTKKTLQKSKASANERYKTTAIMILLLY